MNSFQQAGGGEEQERNFQKQTTALNLLQFI